MPVSAILLAALAPITGALFGASYGTSIRIGYEIIFPALFGDMINDQKNNPTKSSEDGAKRTIKALHTMFTATGGASAMEFGIEQGIEMAKKKTESPDVQHMIDLSLGLTEAQLTKGAKRFGGGLTTQEKKRQQEAEEFEESKQKEGFATPPHDVDEKNIMEKNYPDTTQGNADLFKIMNFGSDFGKRNTKQKKALIALYQERKNLGRFKKKSAEEKIKETSTGRVQKTALLFNTVRGILANYRKFPTNKQMRKLLTAMKAYNRFVPKHLQIDTAKTLAKKQIVGRKSR